MNIQMSKTPIGLDGVPRPKPCSAMSTASAAN
jgi:hypothetical protein